MRTRVLLAAGLVACGGKKDSGAPAAPPRDASVVARAVDAGRPVDGGAVVGSPRDRVPPPALRVARAEVDAFLARWLAAQNGGDLAAYRALYADPFRGVRRSGKQAVALDRPGWMKDRAKMFKRPMVVAIRDLEVVLGAGRATARFTQDWASGAYHDVGPKEIELVAEAGGLRIAREEMLASTLVPATPPSSDEVAALPVLPVWGDRVVLTGGIEPGWVRGAPQLLFGSMPPRDPACDSDPPDYERENGRYFECQESDPQRGARDFVAEAKVAVAKLPPALAAWRGRTLHLDGGKDPPCTATIVDLVIHAERETTFGAVTATPEDEAALAAGVLATGQPVLTGVLDHLCAAAWARPAELPPARAWDARLAPPDVAAAVRARMVDAAMIEDVEDADVEVALLSGPRGVTHVLASRETGSCEPDATHALYTLDGGKLGDEQFSDGDPGVITDVVDVGGDLPILVFEDGLALPDADGTYERIRLIRFPDEIEDCGD